MQLIAIGKAAWSNIFSTRRSTYIALAILLSLALLLRLLFLRFQSIDYIHSLNPWLHYMQSHNGFATLKDQFSDENIPYQTLLAAISYLPAGQLVVIKLISLCFDFLLSFFVYLLVKLKHERADVAIASAMVVLFLPTVVSNSAVWGQCDSIYTTFCVGSVYFFCRKRPAWACICFGLATAFKLQAIFLSPLLLLLFIKRAIPLKYLLLIPAIFLITLTPAIAAGGNVWQILSIYLFQSKEYDYLKLLTLNAPNIYQWIIVSPADFYLAKDMALLLTGIIVITLMGIVLGSRKSLTADLMIKIALLFSVAMPFFLPMMHERYFYLADIFSVIYVFWNPTYYYFAILSQITSFFPYIYVLSYKTPTIISMPEITFAPLVVLGGILLNLVVSLYRHKDTTGENINAMNHSLHGNSIAIHAQTQHTFQSAQVVDEKK